MRPKSCRSGAALGAGDLGDAAEPGAELAEGRQRGRQRAGVVGGVAGDREPDRRAHDRDRRCRRRRSRRSRRDPSAAGDPPGASPASDDGQDPDPPAQATERRSRSRRGAAVDGSPARSGTQDRPRHYRERESSPVRHTMAPNDCRGETLMSPGPEDQWRPPEPPPGRPPRPGRNGSPQAVRQPAQVDAMGRSIGLIVAIFFVCRRPRAPRPRRRSSTTATFLTLVKQDQVASIKYDVVRAARSPARSSEASPRTARSEFTDPGAAGAAADARRQHARRAQASRGTTSPGRRDLLGTILVWVCCRSC